jgi:hypothetical protein
LFYASGDGARAFLGQGASELQEIDFTSDRLQTIADFMRQPSYQVPYMGSFQDFFARTAILAVYAPHRLGGARQAARREEEFLHLNLGILAF